MTLSAELDALTRLGAVANANRTGPAELRADTVAAARARRGASEAKAGSEPKAVYRVASPGYFRAIAQPLVAGRDFDERDRVSGVPVAIVNRSLAARWWPNGDALGARVAFTTSGGPSAYMTIVGIVGNVRQNELTAEAADDPGGHSKAPVRP